MAVVDVIQNKIYCWHLLPLKVVKITLQILQITQEKEAFNLITHNNTNYQEAPGDKL